MLKLYLITELPYWTRVLAWCAVLFVSCTALVSDVVPEHDALPDGTGACGKRQGGQAMTVQWVVQGLYDKAIGWEAVCPAESLADAEARLREYQEREPMFQHRIVEEEP